MSIESAHEGGDREWEPEPFELPLVDPGSSRLPPKTPRPYDDPSPYGDDSDDTDEAGNRVIVIDLA